MNSDRRIFRLSDVAQSIRKTLGERYGSSFWVKAEMNKLNHYAHSGHAYPELVEKNNGKIATQFRAHMWKEDFERADREFREKLREPLRDGIKILFLARIIFEPAHGLSLQILEIDPDFTLGDLEREKAETIQKLQSEGIFARNKTLALPLLPKRIAVISVETSKGYADFIRVLEDNSWGYVFIHHLFPSVLQGEKAVDGIISQLARIEKAKEHFDVVALVRGGGGDVGLSCYNNYRLARAIALFPLPVISGIGHATNHTVAELVSSQNGITPTKIAEFLIQKFHDFSRPVLQAEEIIRRIPAQWIQKEKTGLAALMRLFRSVSGKAVSLHKHRLSQAESRLAQRSVYLLQGQSIALTQIASGLPARVSKEFRQSRQHLEILEMRLPFIVSEQMKKEQFSLEHLELAVGYLDPVNILKRGFSITRFKGKSVSDPAMLADEAVIETTFYKGKVRSTVRKTTKN